MQTDYKEAQNNYKDMHIGYKRIKDYKEMNDDHREMQNYNSHKTTTSYMAKL